MVKKIVQLSRNFYFATGFVFLVWMLFFDGNDIYSQFMLKGKRLELEDQKAYYEEKILEVNADRDALMHDRDLLEKFAREKYFMRREGEDVFVIVEEE